MPSPAHDRLGRLQRPAAGEHRQPPQQRPLRLGEQVVAPVDQRPQRLLAGQRRAAAAGQQPEAVVQPRRDLLHRQRLHPRRRQLDRQRDAVQPLADLRHGRRVLLRECELGRPQVARSTNSRTASDSLEAAPVVATCRALGYRQRGHAPDRSPVTPSGSRLVARMRRFGQARKRRRHDARDQEMFAVVQQQQERAVPKCSISMVVTVLPGSRNANASATASGTRVGSQRGQFDQPDAIRVGREHVGATCRASRVLPQPPAPVRVKRWVVGISRLNSAISPSRPTKLVHRTGRLCVNAASDRILGSA